MLDELVTVATYAQPIEAHAAKNFLEENGVQAFISDEFMSTQLVPNLVDVELQVAVADEALARELLATKSE